MRKDSFANLEFNPPVIDETWRLQAWGKPRLSLAPFSGLTSHLKMWQCKHPESRWYGKGDTPRKAYDNWAWLHSKYRIHYTSPEKVRQLEEERQVRKILEHGRAYGTGVLCEKR